MTDRFFGYTTVWHHATGLPVKHPQKRWSGTEEMEIAQARQSRAVDVVPGTSAALPSDGRREAGTLLSGSDGQRCDLNVGMVFNPKARRNRADSPSRTSAVIYGCAAPQTLDELQAALASFAADGVNVLVVDGGDGTLRDVITAVPAAFAGHVPDVIVLPSGKTNAMALDLGIPPDWTLASALESLRARRFRTRSALRVSWSNDERADIQGFMFGAGAFVRATEVAQRTHRLGAVDGLAVGLSIAAAIARTVCGGRSGTWRRGDRTVLSIDGGAQSVQDRYLLLASTLERLPLGVKPFGRPRCGMKMLAIDAFPSNVLISSIALLSGSEAAWLERAGFHRCDPHSVDMDLDGDFILDGERFQAGRITLSSGDPIRFVVP